MGWPMIPGTPEDARLVYWLLADHLRELACAPASADALAIECAAHLAGILDDEPPRRPRVVVLHGPNLATLSTLGREAADAMSLPHTHIGISGMSEVGWHGEDLSDQLATLNLTLSRWTRQAVVILAGLDHLRVESGTYQAGASSGTTRDYRRGKSGNVAALLRGDTIAGERLSDWDARRALLIVTASELLEHDEDALSDWGLTRELSSELAGASWIHVPRAAGRIAEREIRDSLAHVTALYAAMGYHLHVSDEAVRWAAAKAEERGDSPAVAAEWIAGPARVRLRDMLARGVTDTYIPVGPDDVVSPPPSRPRWIE
jgi:hypothetical protein